MLPTTPPMPPLLSPLCYLVDWCPFSHLNNMLIWQLQGKEKKREIKGSAEVKHITDRALPEFAKPLLNLKPFQVPVHLYVFWSYSLVSLSLPILLTPWKAHWMWAVFVLSYLSILFLPYTSTLTTHFLICHDHWQNGRRTKNLYKSIAIQTLSETSNLIALQ